MVTKFKKVISMINSTKPNLVLISGGTGSFGNAFVNMTLASSSSTRIIIYSRDEMKQWEMAKG